jgi:hypothetical protein
MAALPLGREQDAAYHAQRDNHRGADPVEVWVRHAQNGLASRSPIVAASGRVRMKATQNSKVREAFVRK